MSTRPADYAVAGVAGVIGLVLLGIQIGEARALHDLAVTCLPQHSEKRLLQTVQTVKPEPSVTCVFEYAPPQAVKIRRRAARA